MNFSVNITLKHRASVAVISHLWNQQIAEILKIFSETTPSITWTEIEDNIFSAIRKLELPQELLVDLKNNVQPMGMQLQKWNNLTAHARDRYCCAVKPLKFIWTDNGFLDFRETAQLLIKDNNDKMLCFYLAAVFCMEKDMLKFWPYVRHKFRKAHDIVMVLTHLLYYWIHYLSHLGQGKNRITLFCNIRNSYEFGIRFATNVECEPALDYFFKKLPPHKRRKHIEKAFDLHILGCESNSAWEGKLVRFLFSYLEESDIIRITNRYHYPVLASLLNWPYQDLFIANVTSSWPHLSNIEYQNLFLKILGFMSKYPASDIYKNLIKQFWWLTPLSFKEYILKQCVSERFLLKIFEYENTDDIIQMIFFEFNLFGKKEIILCLEAMETCDLLLKREKWHALKLFIKGCILSPETLKEFMYLYDHYKTYHDKNENDQQTENLFRIIRQWY